MTVGSGWVPEGIDTTKANIARVYDYWLGGDHNFQADRDAARTIIALTPNARAVARANRAFLGRAVRFLAGQAGIRQFLDIGSGIPTGNNVHQVAQATAAGTHVVYADNDDVVVAHSRLMLQDNPDAAVIQADLRDPGKILADPETERLLDFGEPVAVVLSAVLHFIPSDDEAASILATLRGALAPGSYVVICHGCRDEQPGLASSFEDVYNSRVTARLRLRTRDEITRLCDGFTLIDPGLVWIPQWRPDSPADIPDDPEKYWGLVGVARYDGDGPPPPPDLSHFVPFYGDTLARPVARKLAALRWFVMVSPTWGRHDHEYFRLRETDWVRFGTIRYVHREPFTVSACYVPAALSE